MTNVFKFALTCIFLLNHVLFGKTLETNELIETVMERVNREVEKQLHDFQKQNQDDLKQKLAAITEQAADRHAVAACLGLMKDFSQFHEVRVQQTEPEKNCNTICTFAFNHVMKFFIIFTLYHYKSIYDKKSMILPIFIV